MKKKMTLRQKVKQLTDAADFARHVLRARGGFTAQEKQQALDKLDYALTNERKTN